MKTWMCAAALLLAGTISAGAQQRQPDPNDPNGQPKSGTRGQARPGATAPAKQPPPAATPAPKPVVAAPPPPPSRPVASPPPRPVAVAAPPPSIFLPPQRKVFVPVAPPQRPGWSREEHPYQARYHRECQEKAHNLMRYERHAADDGYISPRERRTISALRRDLDRTCGGFRSRG